jgi:hypothetical protein
LLNYDEIRIGSLSSGLFSAHQVAPLLPFVRPGSFSLGGHRCGLRRGAWLGLRRGTYSIYTPFSVFFGSACEGGMGGVTPPAARLALAFSNAAI